MLDSLIQKFQLLAYVKPKKGLKKVNFEDGYVVTLPCLLKQLRLTLDDVVFQTLPSV